MMSHGNNFDDIGVAKIDNAEREFVEEIPAIPAVNVRPAVRRLSDAYHGSVQFLQEGVRQRSVAREVPSPSCFRFICSKRMESD